MFVAREGELGQLDGFLDQALAGQGQVCFVTGEAGSGKTSLVTEFARRAQERHPDLIVAVGQGDAETGAGDAYLPFREVLGLLTGDVEAKLSQGAISQENAGRLRRILTLSGEALVECGPDLIGVFVPGAGLALRVGTFVVEKVGWLDKLKGLTGRTAEREAPGGGVQQEHILEQYTNVLRALAEKRPLMLVLDDLQWADSASMGLLFRLGRRIGDRRILIVGTYRPEEVALGRGGERHPLEKVVAEFKRYLGDVWVDLDQAQEGAGRRFVDALLDGEPNRLGEGFRAAMHGHTGGHPLFTVELLRELQERGALVRDEEGGWVEGAGLDWEVLPTRVEGVIEERIGRLEGELREVLTVASVEGEGFTAQVVARVREMNERDLVHRLGRELDRQHHLVREQGTARVREQRLALYRFRHHLFQSYLYHDLGQAEREWLHEDVGNVLEALYGEQADEIAVQLARHFEQAGVREKARHYLGRAGEQAYRRYASEEAVAYLSQALALTEEGEQAARYALLLVREQAYHRRGVRDEQRADLAALAGLAEALDDDGRRAEVALRQARYAEATSDFGGSIAAAQRVLELAEHQSGEGQAGEELAARAHLDWGTALWRQGHYDESQAHLQQALPIFQRIGAAWQAAETLRALGTAFFYQGHPTVAQDYGRQALAACRQVGDRRGEAAVLNNLAIAHGSMGQYAQTDAYLRQALDIIRRVGDRRAESKMLGNLGALSASLGQPGQAKAYARQVLLIVREIGDRHGEGMALHNLGVYAYFLEEYAEARAYHEQELALAREVGDRLMEGLALTCLGGVAQVGGEYAQSEVCYRQALAIWQELDLRHNVVRDLAALAEVALDRGDLDEAQVRVAEVLPRLDDEFIAEGGEDVLVALFCCYRVLLAGEDRLAAHLLGQADALLQDQASQIADEALRRSFLENVATHRQIMDAVAQRATSP